MCLVLMLLIASRKHWMLEQPGTSIMRESKWMRFIRQLQRVYNVRTWMSCFGAETQKATQLESGSLWVNRLHRKRNIKNTRSSITEVLSTTSSATMDGGGISEKDR